MPEFPQSIGASGRRSAAAPSPATVQLARLVVLSLVALARADVADVSGVEIDLDAGRHDDAAGRGGERLARNDARPWMRRKALVDAPEESRCHLGVVVEEHDDVAVREPLEVPPSRIAAACGAEVLGVCDDGEAPESRARGGGASNAALWFLVSAIVVGGALGAVVTYLVLT